MKNTNKTNTIDVKNALREIELSAKANDLELRFVPDDVKVGQGIRQGDVYLWRVAEIPKNYICSKDRQIVKGTTQGSRHTVDNSVSVYWPISRTDSDDQSIEGPYLQSDSRFNLQHPEHAWHSLPQGYWKVTYQVHAPSRAWNERNTSPASQYQGLNRVRD